MPRPRRSHGRSRQAAAVTRMSISVRCILQSYRRQRHTSHSHRSRTVDPAALLSCGGRSREAKTGIVDSAQDCDNGEGEGSVLP